MLLTTFRKDGTPVPTPVWVTRADDELRVWSAPDAGKIKRIRRSGAVQVAPCTIRGEPRGESIDATARLLPESEIPALLDALAGKYGLLAWLTTLSVRYFGRRGAVIGVVVP
jgi:PPOX class probable F420-dependent enzyme